MIYQLDGFEVSDEEIAALEAVLIIADPMTEPAPQELHLAQKLRVRLVDAVNERRTKQKVWDKLEQLATEFFANLQGSQDAQIDQIRTLVMEHPKVFRTKAFLNWAISDAGQAICGFHE